MLRHAFGLDHVASSIERSSSQLIDKLFLSFPLRAGHSPAMSLTYTKKEEESGLSSYYNNKTTIIQEARVFNESPISPRKCRALLTRIVYLLYIGETFGTQEATTLFFGTTKLFQHKDVSSQRQITRLYPGLMLDYPVAEL